MGAVVTVRKVRLGEGRPKICVPLVAADWEGLKAALLPLFGTPFDLIEWRADHYRAVRDPVALRDALATLREAIGDAPLLFTLRTKGEGGEAEISPEAYVELLLSAIESGLVDLVDAELSQGEAAFRAVAEAAHRVGVKVIGSRHDFSSTPGKEAIMDTLRRTQALGADVVKFAVTPRNGRDVLTLLDATLSMLEEGSPTPVITMSMGRLGAVSRVCGQVFGSCLTFGTAGKASAPGQLPAERLAAILDDLGSLSST